MSGDMRLGAFGEAGENVLPGSNPGDGKYQHEAGALLDPASPEAPLQMTLDIQPSCKERGCSHPVVGNSITGVGHVCKRHNEVEWGNALLRSEFSDYRAMGARMVA